MKEFKLNPNSWHFKLATWRETKYEKEYLQRVGTDICSYTKKVLGGLFAWIFLIALLSALVAWFGKGLYDIVMLFFGGENTPFSFSLIVALISFGGLASVAFVKEYIQDRAASVKDGQKEPTFVGLAYRKFKDKTCFKINFK